ncbi:MAG: type II toxin-antitoxin system RelE/ParE family toxin [Burkholderiaceae bacterium]
MAWKVRLAEHAEVDFLDISAWTRQHFGERQAENYAETLSRAIEALLEGPEIPGAKVRDEIGPGIRTLHVARAGRSGRHFVVFRISGNDTIDVLRLLHDSMDLARHIP